MLVALSLLIGAPSPALAHGIWGHVHVTGWAVENMPDDELRAFLLEPEVFNALLFGAVFTDTGYAIPSGPTRAYSEHTHWEPFIEDAIQWIQANDPPPWTTLESRKRVAFLMGCASHGLQDSIFDSLFLPQIEEHDGKGQDAADPATDGFLVIDAHVRFVPEVDLPMDTLLELYADLEEEVTEEVILEAVERTVSVYVNPDIGWGVAEGMAAIHEPSLPWTRLHYMDPIVPGSLRSEILPTMRYQQAVWKRLHGVLPPDDVTVFAYPEAPRRLETHDHQQTSSWASLIFGAGIQYEDDLVELLGPDGAPVPFTQAQNRWGTSYPRLIRVLPDEDLDPGSWYTLRLKEGAQRIDGARTTQPWDHTFQVTCDDTEPERCPDLGDIPVARIDGTLEGSLDTGQALTSEPSTAASGTACGCDGSPVRAPWRGWTRLLPRRR